MPRFPTLKTGAIAQYPLKSAVRYQTQAVRFLDGSSQRYSIQSKGLRRWTVELDLLDDQELAALVNFVEEQGSGVFSWTDPATGATNNNCRMADGVFELLKREELVGQARIEIQEVL
jgi:phage-related protein